MCIDYTRSCFFEDEEDNYSSTQFLVSHFSHPTVFFSHTSKIKHIQNKMFYPTEFRVASSWPVGELGILCT